MVFLGVLDVHVLDSEHQKLSAPVLILIAKKNYLVREGNVSRGPLHGLEANINFHRLLVVARRGGRAQQQKGQTKTKAAEGRGGSQP
jgi:hypothetical protein